MAPHDAKVHSSALMSSWLAVASVPHFMKQLRLRPAEEPAACSSAATAAAGRGAPCAGQARGQVADSFLHASRRRDARVHLGPALVLRAGEASEDSTGIGPEAGEGREPGRESEPAVSSGVFPGVLPCIFSGVDELRSAVFRGLRSVVAGGG